MVWFALAGPAVLPYRRLIVLLLRDTAVLVLASVALLALVELARRRGAARRRTPPAPVELTRASYWLDLLRILVALVAVQVAHLTLKVFVPVLNPSNHDPLLARIDRWLGLGHDPVPAVLRLFDTPAVLAALDVVYSGVYFLALWGGLLLYLALLERRRRIEFVNGFALMWQLGLLLYVLLPSWGPVFVQPAGFEDALQSMPATVTVQRQLVAETTAIVHGRYDLVIRYFGLAAFPSLHVAVMVLYLLWAPRIARFWTVVSVILVGLITVGSMVTGYHYLIDAVVGALIGAAAWVLGRAAVARPATRAAS